MAKKYALDYKILIYYYRNSHFDIIISKILPAQYFDQLLWVPQKESTDVHDVIEEEELHVPKRSTPIQAQDVHLVFGYLTSLAEE